MAAKFDHVARQNPAGRFAPVAMCGRRVNRLALTSPEKATCPKCREKTEAQRAMSGAK